MITAFCSVYESGSFTKAAERLHMTPPAISYRIRMFEDLLGRALFERSPVGITPTALAHDIHPDVCRILELSRGLLRTVDSESLTGPIRILATQAFASLWLTPRIPQLLETYSGRRFEIVSWIGGGAGLEGSELSSMTDIEIRYAAPDSLPIDRDGHLIAHDAALPVCAPEYFDRLRPEIGPDLPSGTTLIHTLNWPGIWDRWCRAAFGKSAGPCKELHFQSTALCVQAAQSGVGIAMAHAPLVADEIRAGHLVPAHPFRLRVQEAYFGIIGPERRGQLPFFLEFIHWCRREMSDSR